MKNDKKPKIRFKGFDDDWEQRKLGEVSESYPGGTPSVGNKSYYGGSIPFIRSAEINSKSTELFLTEEGLTNSSARMVSKGDILYALYGATSGETGRSRINGAINQAILAILPHDGYDSEFLMQWLRKSKQNITDIYLQGGQGNLSGAIVKALEVNFPSLAEQRQIGNYFQSIDNLITLHQRKCDKLQKIKKSMLEKMFPQNESKKPEIRFKGFNVDWEQRKLSDIVDVLDGDRGKNYPTSDDFDISGHTLFLNASNVTNDGFLFQDNQFITEEKSNSMGNGKLEDDDIVVTSRGSLGHIAWYNADISSFVPYARINSGMLILRNKKEVETEYLYHFMKSSKGQSQISFISFGSAQPQLTKKGVEDLEVILPKRRDEQVQLGYYFSNLDHLITLHQRELEKMKYIKKSMLEKMFV